MYMLSCCLEGLGTPLDYSTADEDPSAKPQKGGDYTSCETQEATHAFGISTGLAVEKPLISLDNTTAVDDSTLFTEQCQAYKESSNETASQATEEPREPEPGTANEKQVPEAEREEETREFPTGVIYKGGYTDGKRHGYGILIRPCGSRYEGEFREDAAHGHGTFYHPSGDVYEGQWQYNKAHGNGRFTHADGSSYEGQWIMDIQEGYGVERWIDGSSYEGNYQGGKKNGEGCFAWPNGSIFKGQFKDNDIEGEGVYHWKDGKTYTGQWVRNHMEGQGRMVLPDGRVYEGMYHQDRKHGKGRLIWPDGHYLEGEWVQGRQVPGVARYFDAQGREMREANEVSQQLSVTATACGKTTTASSKSSLSPHAPRPLPIVATANYPVKAAKGNQQQQLTAIDWARLNDVQQPGVGQQQGNPANTGTPGDSCNLRARYEGLKHKRNDGIEERHGVCEDAQRKKTNKKKSYPISTHQQHHQHSMQGKKHNEKTVAREEAAGFSRIAHHTGAADDSAATLSRNEGRHERGAGKNGHLHQPSRKHYDRRRKTAEVSKQQEGRVLGSKNATVEDSADNVVAGGHKKHPLNGLFARRK